MLEEERLKKQDDLLEIVYKLSRVDTGILSQDSFSEITSELKEIYKNRFRHQYSDLFPAIKTISEDNEYDPETLLENLRLIRDYVEKEHLQTKQYDSLYIPLLKLTDHINLELSRLNIFKTDEQRLRSFDYQVSENRKLLEKSQELVQNANQALARQQESQDEIRSKLDDSTKLLKDANEKVKDANEKAENLQTQLVSVLSIFAAIVIAFSGGVNLLGNAISSLQNVIVYKSILICLLCGLILFNLVFLLLYIVGKMINRNIFANCTANCTCPGSNNNCGNSCSPSCSGFKRIRRRLPYVFWVNVTGLALCVLDVAMWYLRLRNMFPFSF